jgi:hypothetical protein
VVAEEHEAAAGLEHVGGGVDLAQQFLSVNRPW